MSDYLEKNWKIKLKSLALLKIYIRFKFKKKKKEIMYSFHNILIREIVLSLDWINASIYYVIVNMT